MVPGRPPSMILNMDSTQYGVGNQSDGKVAVKIITEEYDEQVEAAPAKDDPAGLQYFIKYVLLIAAAGFQMAPVFIAADSSMDEDAIDSHFIPGLDVSTCVDEGAWLVFSNSRCGNEKFYD